MKLAPPDAQMRLLDCAPRYRIENEAQARCAYGNAAQEIVCAALELTPIRINGNFPICFDAERAGVYYEIKSCKRNGPVVIYNWRMEKERSVEVPLKYAILMHNAPKIRDGNNIFTLLNQRGLDLLLIDAWRVHAIAIQQTTRHCVTKVPLHGSTRVGYRDGYRLTPTRRLIECTHRIVHREFWLHDVLFSVRIHTDSLG